MGSDRQGRRRRVPAGRGLLLGGRDMLLLALCGLVLITAWLVYAASGPAGGPPAYGQAAAATPPAATPLPPSNPSPAASPTGSGLIPFAQPHAAAPDSAAPAPAPRGPAASAPRRLTYPAAGMDVVVRPLEPDSGAEGGSIVPPETMDGYWLTPFGTPGAGSENTTYVIGHSWEGLDAPFNHLSSSAAPGDTLTLATGTGTLQYVVDSVATHTKSTLKDSSVWDAVPNRLVLISCYTEDPWGKNVVVVATPVRGP